MFEVKVIVEVDELESFFTQSDLEYKKPSKPVIKSELDKWANDIFPRNIIEGKVFFVPLKPSTLEIRKRKGFTGPILYRTGELALSLQILSLSDNTGEVGSTFDWAIQHEIGGVTDSDSAIPGKTIPPRPFLIVTNKLMDGATLAIMNFHFKGWG